MAFSNLKSNPKPLSSTLIKIFIISLFLQYNNVHSQSPQLSLAETIAFTLTQFEVENPNLFTLGDVSFPGGILSLTKTDQNGNPLLKSTGRAQHLTAIHIWDKSSGKLADFSTGFSFIVNTTDPEIHGDGFTFFLGPLSFDLPEHSSDGYLGLFDPKTAFTPSENPILAVEFDSFTNGWDPNAPFQSPHIGIDVGSILSVATTPWPLNSVPRNALGEASINYNSESKILSVSVDYPGTELNSTSISYVVDLRSVLPEWVRVGFSASTGELAETHEIINWTFESAL